MVQTTDSGTRLNSVPTGSRHSLLRAIPSSTAKAESQTTEAMKIRQERKVPKKRRMDQVKRSLAHIDLVGSDRLDFGGDAPVSCEQ